MTLLIKIESLSPGQLVAFKNKYNKTHGTKKTVSEILETPILKYLDEQEELWKEYEEEINQIKMKYNGK